MSPETLQVETPYAVRAATIKKTRRMTELEKYFEFEFADGELFDYDPGQFVMISVPGVGEAPISVSSSPTQKGTFELVVRNAGSVTNALHQMDAGDVVGIRGPFGRGFPTEELKGHDLIMIGGGCGNIPLHSLINFVLDNRKDYGEVDILLGCRTPQSMLFTDEFDQWVSKPNVKLEKTVDQAGPDWKGHVGVITKLIPDVKIDKAKTYAVVVGPPVMYKFVIQELKKRDLPDKQIILSLERHMKCGVGKCGHCQIEHYYCCQEGPVFSYDQIKANHEAL